MLVCLGKTNYLCTVIKKQVEQLKHYDYEKV